MTDQDSGTRDTGTGVWTASAVPGGGHRYAAADAELVGYFTASVGVRAQQYEGSGGAFSSIETHTARLKAMRWLDAGSPPSAMVIRDRVAGSLSELPRAHIETLTAVYAPHAWPATWLASALACSWGGGSLAVVALALPRAPQALGRWLLDVDRPVLEEWKRRKGLCGGLVCDAEVVRMAAVEAYDVVRRARIEAEVLERRQVAAERREAGAKRLAEDLGMSRRIERAQAVNRQARAAALAWKVAA